MNSATHPHILRENVSPVYNLKDREQRLLK